MPVCAKWGFKKLRKNLSWLRLVSWLIAADTAAVGSLNSIPLQNPLQPRRSLPFTALATSGFQTRHKDTPLCLSSGAAKQVNPLVPFAFRIQRRWTSLQRLHNKRYQKTICSRARLPYFVDLVDSSVDILIEELSMVKQMQNVREDIRRHLSRYNRCDSVQSLPLKFCRQSGLHFNPSSLRAVCGKSQEQFEHHGSLSKCLQTSTDAS